MHEISSTVGHEGAGSPYCVGCIALLLRDGDTMRGHEEACSRCGVGLDWVRLQGFGGASDRPAPTGTITLLLVDNFTSAGSVQEVWAAALVCM